MKWPTWSAGLPARIVIAIAVEIAYAVITRAWLPHHVHGAPLEIWVSVLRLTTAGIYWLLFRELILGRRARNHALRHPLVYAGTAAVLAIPFLFRGWDPGGGLGTAIVFALTSIAVGLREELLYRAVVINFLQPRVGAGAAIVLSTIVFLIYHYGALPLKLLPAIEVICMSLLLGLVYVYSGSLLFVVALHSLYDGIWFFGPYIPAPLPNIWRVAFLVSGLVLIFVWARTTPDFSLRGRQL